MANLFFSLPSDLAATTTTIFRVIGASSVEGDSANVLGGTYTMASVLGFKIKLELNSYDYEDQYNYMLSVTEDYATGLRVDDAMEEAMAGIVAQLLSKNLPLAIAQELSDGLHIYAGAVS
ncbi:MAG: hypothetical protein EOO55_03115 [Hymenobacter sp.]|nr:MAG: hypothetical protein EOO55_03115 [Hymenobacter sp.]